MRVSLISEGAYPHSFGGVSVWCDQLVRRSTSVDFTLVSLVATGNEQPVWQLPENVTGLTTIPLWGPAAPRRSRLSRSARSEFRPLLWDLLRCLLAERDPSAEARFGQVLRLLFDFAQFQESQGNCAEAVDLFSAFRARRPRGEQSDQARFGRPRADLMPMSAQTCGQQACKPEHALLSVRCEVTH